jgi:hypothetical protein
LNFTLTTKHQKGIPSEQLRNRFIPNKVLKWVKIIPILSYNHVGNSIWNHNPQFVTLKKLHRRFKKSLKSGKSFFYKGKKALTGF